jgi:hypothetical protein
MGVFCPVMYFMNAAVKMLVMEGGSLRGKIILSNIWQYKSYVALRFLQQ